MFPYPALSIPATEQKKKNVDMNKGTEHEVTFQGKVKAY